MKTVIQSVIVIAVTTILVSAFRFIPVNMPHTADAVEVTKVIIIGKRMTTQQKSAYDAQLSVAVQ